MVNSHHLVPDLNLFPFNRATWRKWVRFPIDFYEWPVIKKIRTYAAGDTYVVLYQRIMLYAAQVDGCIRYHGYDETFAKEVALILSENARDIEMALGYMETHGLIEVIGENVYLLPHVPPMIEQEGESTARVRAYRDRQKNLPSPKKALTSAERVRAHRARKKIEEAPQNCETNPNMSSKNDTLHERYINVTDVTNVTEKCNGDVTGKTSLNPLFYDVSEDIVTCNDQGRCNGDVTEERYKCNEISVTCNVTDVTNVTEDRYINVTNVTGKIAQNALFYDVLGTDVTCNENETLMQRKCNAIDIDKDRDINTGGIRARARDNIPEDQLDRYLSFRLSADNIQHPMALERMILKGIVERGDEYVRFLEWQELMQSRPIHFVNLITEFAAFGQKDRRICREIVEDKSYLAYCGIDEVSPVLFELAFFESSRVIDEQTKNKNSREIK